jgi:hypothetical protein
MTLIRGSSESTCSLVKRADVENVGGSEISRRFQQIAADVLDRCISSTETVRIDL